MPGLRRIRPDRHHQSGSGRVLIVSGTVGQGHEGAARELARRLAQRGIDADVRDYLDALPVAGRSLLRDGYRPTVEYAPAVFERLFAGMERDRPLQRAVDLLCRTAEPAMLRWARDAEAVVSTYPFASQTLGRLRARGALDVPAVTFLTDPAAHRLWCHPDVDHHLTVTSATARDGTRYGVSLQAAGALCAPHFSRVVPRAVREQVRAVLGLPAGAPAVLVGGGSLGMGQVSRIVTAVLHHPHAVAVVLCGRNGTLQRRLRGQDRVVALGWRDDVPELMAASDVLVHNAGGLLFTEALVAGLPAVTYLPVAGHGRANADLLARAGLAPWPRTPAELVGALDATLARPRAAPSPRSTAAVADPSAIVAELVARRPDVRPASA